MTFSKNTHRKAQVFRVKHPSTQRFRTKHSTLQLFMSDFNRNAMVIAITGGIACGKSEVGRILEEMGFALCDADIVAHRLMMPGTDVFGKIIKHFGRRILQDNGEISRPVLGQIIFNHPEERLVLNELVHPAVRRELIAWIKEMRKNGRNAAVQIPLLYESGMEELGWDTVFCVSSSEELMLERLQARGLEHDEAMKRIESQMSLREKECRADAVIQNQTTLEELKQTTQQAVMAAGVERV